MRHFFSLHTERFLLTWLTLTVGKQRPHEYFAMEKEERCGCDCTDEILIRFSSRQASNAHGFVALSFVYSFVDKSFQGGRMLLTVLASRPKNGRALSSETWNFLAFLTCFFSLSCLCWSLCSPDISSSSYFLLQREHGSLPCYSSLEQTRQEG